MEQTVALKAADLAPRIGSELLVDKQTLLHGDVAGAIRELLVRRGVLIAHWPGGLANCGSAPSRRRATKAC